SEIILAWARGQATRATPITWARRLEVVRPFAKYRARIEAGTQIPAADIFGRAHRRLTPHIYTEAGIADLVAAAGQVPPQGTLRAATCRPPFGLSAAPGLRLSEALDQRCSDVDVGLAQLTVRRTKFCKARLLPLHSTVTAALGRYAAVRQRYVAPSP